VKVLTAESEQARSAGDERVPPGPRDVAHLKATNAGGAVRVGWSVLCTAGGIALSLRPEREIWAAGQILLSIAMVQWFCLLHEAGHHTLFRARSPHVLVGHVAAFFSGLPFPSWKTVHNLHHKWAGWQDVDPTTATFAPRPPGQERSRFEMILGNLCWKLSIPYFAIHYRVAFLKFWRIKNAATDLAGKRSITTGTLGLLASYALLAAVLGPMLFVKIFALSAVLSLVWVEPIMLSQHTHIPMKLAKGASVAAIASAEQEPYTRSLRVPGWMAAAILFHFDAHELHHMYPWLPGYALRKVPYATVNEMRLFPWLLAVKRMSAEDFMLKNRNDTGNDV
jgi:omega-6 fatty acid desaturase (delta-12 desaturase)